MKSRTEDIDEFFGKGDRDSLRKQASHECKYLQDITSHIESFVGKIDYVEHEIVSFTVHTDILVVQPTEKVPYVTIVTSGMSDKRMMLPKGIGGNASNGLAEFIAFLPPDWLKRGESDAGEESDFDWPQSIIRSDTKYVHESGSYYDWFHTTSNGTPPSQFVPDTEMSGFLLSPPSILPEIAWEVRSQSGDRIRLLNVVPILRDEIKFGIRNGGESLMELFTSADRKLVFDPQRPSCLPQRKKFFGLF